jgi:hypothetical protein
MLNEDIISGVIIVGLLLCSCCISEAIFHGCNEYEEDQILYTTDYKELNSPNKN